MLEECPFGAKSMVVDAINIFRVSRKFTTKDEIQYKFSFSILLPLHENANITEKVQEFHWLFIDIYIFLGE